MSSLSLSAERLAPPPSDLQSLLDRLEAVRTYLLEVEGRVPLDAFGAARESARNLLHYVALRQFDLRWIQNRLSDLGLSSLGRAEGHVLFNLDATLAQLYTLTGRRPPVRVAPRSITPEEGRRRLAQNASRLFGRPYRGRETRIMVTLPLEAAEDADYLRRLLESGTDCVRINCAHDTEADWQRMIGHLRTAERAVGRRCRVEMDLGGPRLRTGPVRPGPAVLRIRPQRDPYGRVVRPGVLVVSSSDRPDRRERQPLAAITAPMDWIRRRRQGETIRVKDARGAVRAFRVESRSPSRLVLSQSKTTYLTNGLVLEGRLIRGRRDRAVVDGIQAQAGRIRLAPGSWLKLTRGTKPGSGEPTRRSPATISVSEPSVLDRVRRGDRVSFDAGRIGGVAHSVSPQGVLVKITSARPQGTWLRADQGINLPDTDIGLGPLNEQDDRDLQFIVRHADLVGYSFVHSAEEIALLRRRLRELGRPRMGIVLKIETRQAFEQLPAILLGALRSGPTGVMVARGDLAVEVGFERLAEVQEEILWLSEAAHLPAVWATQVLEGLAKTGTPTRAEVTDAAMGERAECVMLNKGPYLPEAVQALDSIIRRMQSHQGKKSARLRHLRVAERFLASTALGSPHPVVGLRA